MPEFVRRHWWIAALIAALGLLGVDGAQKLHRMRALAALGEARSPEPERDPRSPTGYRWGQRNQILFAEDGYNWIMQTQAMGAGGGLRVRRADYDNYPYGRDVHWSWPLHGWLAALGWIESRATGDPWPIAVERAAPLSNALLLAMLVLAIVPLAARKFGSSAGALLALGLVAVAPFSVQFEVGGPDHRGLASVCAFLSLLFLLAGRGGWAREGGPGEPAPDDAGGWFIASGVAGGIGLWISAATLVPVLAGIGIGALASGGWLARGLGRDAGLKPRPDLWRAWGVSGGAASLLFYFVEYFPSHLGVRLEVNHPIYALAWAGAGDLLCRACRRLQGGTLATSSGDRLWAGASCAALVLPAVTLLAGGEGLFVISNPLMWALHNDYIEEFFSMAHRLRGLSGFELAHALLFQVNLLPLLGLGMAWLCLGPALSRPAKAILALAAIPAAISGVLAVRQNRWLSVSDALWLAALVAIVHVIGSGPGAPGRRIRRFRLAGCAFLLPVLLPYPVGILGAASAAKPASAWEFQQLVSRDLAHWLRNRTGDEGGVILSGPSATTELIYFGGFKGIGTLYWENLSGLKALAAIYGASSPERALELIRQRGITHIVVYSWNSFADAAARLERGLRVDQPAPANAFMTGLLRSPQGPPTWLRPIFYPLPPYPGVKDPWVLVLEVVPGQSPEEAYVRNLQFLLADGNREKAASALGILRESGSRYLPALILEAQTAMRLGEKDAFDPAIGRIRAALENALYLELDDRIDLAVVLATAGEPGLARRQLAYGWISANERSLRRLSPARLSALLELSRRLEVPDIPAAALALATGLEPAPPTP